MLRDGVDLVIGQDDQPTRLRLRFHDQKVPDGHVVREDLQRLDEHGFRSRQLARKRVGEFQDPAVSRADEEDVVDAAVHASNPGIDGDDGQAFAKTRLDEDGGGIRTGDRPVHQRVALDEVEARFRQSVRVVVAKPGPGLRDLRPGGREPVGVDRLLVLEGPVFEGGEHVRELEAADGAAGDGVVGRREDAVKDLLVLGRAAVDRLGAFDEPGRRLDLVEVERDLARDGAVEPGLEEGRPLVVELVRAALVVLANASDS